MTTVQARINKIRIMSKIRALYAETGVRHINREVLAGLLKNHEGNLAREGCPSIADLISGGLLEERMFGQEKHYMLTDYAFELFGINPQKGPVEYDKINGEKTVMGYPSPGHSTIDIGQQKGYHSLPHKRPTRSELASALRDALG